MKKINSEFKGKHVGLPLIGCGIAGGIWERNLKNNPSHKTVKEIIQTELKDCDVTVVHYKK